MENWPSHMVQLHNLCNNTNFSTKIGTKFSTCRFETVSVAVAVIVAVDIAGAATPELRHPLLEFNILYRLTSSFFALREYFDGNVSCPGLYGGLYGHNLPYKFKKLYGDLRNRNFKKSHRTSSPQSDLRPDL